MAGKKKRGGEKKGPGGGTERLARSDPARGQFRAQLVARFFKMGGRNSNDEKTDGGKKESDAVEQTRRARAVGGRLRAKKVDEKGDTMSMQLALRSARGSGRAVGRATRKGDKRNP